MSKLKLEVFESDKEIKPIRFYVYKAVPNEQVDSIQQFMRRVAGKISYRQNNPAFTDDKRIFTLTPIKNPHVDNSCTITFEKEETLDIQIYKKVYVAVVDLFIKKKLQQIKVDVVGIQGRRLKYVIQNKVTSAYFSEKCGSLSSSDKQFRLIRKYNYSIKISNENKVQLWLRISSGLETAKNIYSYILNNKDVKGLKVINIWNKIGETGTIQFVEQKTVVDNLHNFMPLKQYWLNKNPNIIKDCPDNSPVVRVKMKKGNECYYYPQSLKPVVTLERIASENPSFSKQIEKFTKLDMTSRQRIAKEFLFDIGTIEQLNNIKFNTDYIDANKLGFIEKSFLIPKIICGNGNRIDYNKQFSIFKNGFYKQPENPVKFAYFYPRCKEELMRKFSISLIDFLQKGSLFGDTKFLIPNLMSSELRAVCAKEYELGNITNYKKLVRSVSENHSFDIAVVLVPTEEDETNPYSAFKKAWAKENIPSQMISIKTAQMFANKDPNTVWFMHNIALGIFAKSGGIPWIVEDIPGEIDCFVGIDVATIEKGIHYSTCATVFDKNGRPINFYKPKTPQNGEKIDENILQEIFDEIIIGYEEATGTKIKNLVIHRDGFSNEDAEWYKKYFAKQDINYSVIEVKKFVASKMLREENGIARNPQFCDALINEDEAFIVTTDIKDGRASPCPLHIKKQVGNLSMEIIIRQILALSCMNFGATKKSRLPVTTYYADRICKNIDYVLEGKFGNRLFFL